MSSNHGHLTPSSSAAATTAWPPPRTWPRPGGSVLVLEKLEHPGGAAVSAHAFDGVDARLSRYSYLVSLLPQQIIDDLGLRITLARRRYSSYTPDPADGSRALLVDNGDEAATAASFAAVGAPDGEFRRLHRVLRRLPAAHRGALAHHDRAAAGAVRGAGPRARAGAAEAWEAMIEQPIGRGDRRGAGQRPGPRRGPDRRADRYLRPGRRRGPAAEHLLPVPPDRRRDGRLGRAGRRHGRGLRRAGAGRARRRGDHPDLRGGDGRPPGGGVGYRHGGRDRGVGPWVLSNVAPAVLDRLRGRPSRRPVSRRRRRPEIRTIAARARRSRSTCCSRGCRELLDGAVSPEAAFGGTFHINETWDQLDAAVQQRRRRIRALAAAVRDLLPLADRPQHPVPGAAGRRRADADACSACTSRTGWSPAENNEDRRARTAGGRPGIPELGAGRAHRGPAHDGSGRRGPASKPRPPWTSSAPSACPAATSSTAASTGRSWRTANRWTPRRAAGAWRRTIRRSCCAAPVPAAAAPSARIGGHNAAMAVLESEPPLRHGCRNGGPSRRQPPRRRPLSRPGPAPAAKRRRRRRA